MSEAHKFLIWRAAHLQRMRGRAITAEFCGDPGPGRSALDGWQQRGEGFCDAGHFESARGVKKRTAKDARDE
jgi:hypothetical protein